ncbi:uncharacterized protein LOC141617686 [Silene latifolia]|uniref:uncharacterized protein LOC141617686 n=1 Tax=Silene latifolia TaxID=37657 RepID=UPI003D78274D
MKNEGWFDYKPKSGASWSWRKLCGVKEKLKAAYRGEWWMQQRQKYIIHAGYNWLGTSNPKVDWNPFVWNNLSLPKHCLIGWIGAHGRLLTRDRLHQMGICGETVCFAIPSSNSMQWWLKVRMNNLLRKNTIAAGIQALIYRVWEMRNKSRIEGLLLRPKTLILKVLVDVRTRLQMLHSKRKISDSYRDWI